ncbi:WXG100 family type VII secretion target [Neobacillus mesonae]|nr:WXG100 family type VII secretion target [Neobacillus mesonae]
MRIRVEPDVLRTLSSQLKHAAEQIQQIVVGLEQALGGIEGDTAVHEGIVYEWMRSKQLAGHIELELERFGTELLRKAENFKLADEEYKSFLSHVDFTNVSPMRMLQSQNLDSIKSDNFIAHSISNPRSAVMAIQQSWAGGDKLNDVGTLRLATELNPKGWKFTDPSFDVMVG